MTIGCFDVSCRKCGRKFGWMGTILNRPPCPQCRDVFTPAGLAEAAAGFEKMMERTTVPEGEPDGDALRGFRKESGLTLRQASVVLGVSAATISSWEIERTRPTPEQLKMMYEKYGLTDPAARTR